MHSEKCIKHGQSGPNEIFKAHEVSNVGIKGEAETETNAKLHFQKTLASQQSPNKHRSMM